jgi:hypothetical protein
MIEEVYVSFGEARLAARRDWVGIDSTVVLRRAVGLLRDRHSPDLGRALSGMRINVSNREVSGVPGFRHVDVDVRGGSEHVKPIVEALTSAVRSLCRVASIEVLFRS